MATLQQVRYVVWHTAADGRKGRVNDTSAATIARWHRDRGWAGIGYHYVVRMDGEVEAGRNVTRVGAHVLGLNSVSLGICFSGHGDYAPLTPAQWETGLSMTERLLAGSALNEGAVIGHREVNFLVAHGVVAAKYRTTKTCPGELVDMEEVRLALRERRQDGGNGVVYDRDQAEGLLVGLRMVYQVLPELGLVEAAMDELNAFRRVREVDEVLTWLEQETRRKTEETEADPEVHPGP